MANAEIQKFGRRYHCDDCARVVWLGQRSVPRHRRCRDCLSAQQRKRKREQARERYHERLEYHRAKARERKHAAYWANLEKSRRKNREWSRARRLASRDKMRKIWREHAHKRYWANPEEARRKHREWNRRRRALFTAEDIEKRRIRGRAYYRANHARALEVARRHRQKKRQKQKTTVRPSPAKIQKRRMRRIYAS